MKKNLILKWSLLVSVWCLWVPVCLAETADNNTLQTLEQAEFIVYEGAVPPPDNARWQSVRLLHRWTKQDYAQGRNGWYRLKFNLTELPEKQWGIYLRRFNMNAAIYVNGQLIGDSGSFNEPLSRNWNRPFYLTVPTSEWRTGTNTVLIRLKSYAPYGYLAPVFIGANSILDAEYKWQYLLQVEISQALFPITVSVGLFILGLWWRRREDVQYFWFAIAVLMWSIYSLNMAVKDQPFSTKTWEWIAHSSLDWWVVFLVIFIHRFIGQSRPWLERGCLLFGISASVVYAAVNLETLDTVTRWFHGGSILLGFIVLVELINAARREHQVRYVKLAIGLALLLGLAINDWMFQFKIIGATGDIGLHLHHYFAPLIFFAMAWHLIGRFITALNESETLNRELEDRVQQAQHEIEAHYQTIQEMEKHQAVLQERERFSREIHDGISGNVSNAIMMTELIRKENPQLDNQRLQQLHSHLDDGLYELRNMILAMEEDIPSVNELFSHVNDKYEQVLSLLDIDYSSDFSSLQQPHRLSQSQSLNLLRIMQEALNNIVKHAQATHVSLQVTEQPQSIIFQVTDNGKGFDIEQQNAGHYGLKNMYKRSIKIGANLIFSSSLGEGSQLKLILSLTETTST